MYNELIEVGKDGNVFLQDDSIALMPEMWKVYKDKNLGSKAVKWIVSVYDYKSPFRRLPLEERKSRANYAVYQKATNTKSNNKLMLTAIDEYVKLQYDPLIDEYSAMCEQSYNMTKVYREMIPTEKNLDDMAKLQEQLGKAAKARDAHKTLILKAQKSEAKIQGTDSSDFSIFEQDQLLDSK